jgi:hypothetical protein
MPLVSDEAPESQASEQSGPHVGLFYVVNGKLHWDGVPVEHAGGTPYFKSYPKSFSTYWKDNLVKRFPALREYDPDCFPRGRVVYDAKKDAYDLMADRCILDDPELIKRIVWVMKLPETKLTTSWDINCECPTCKSTRIQKMHATQPDVVEIQLKPLKDGRKAYFPWRSTGYVIPSEGEIRSLRRQLRWEATLTAGIFGGPVAALIFKSIYDWSATPAIHAALITISYVGAFALWVHFRFRGWQRTNETIVDCTQVRFESSGTGAGKIIAAMVGVFLVLLAMWALTKP